MQIPGCGSFYYRSSTWVGGYHRLPFGCIRYLPFVVLPHSCFVCSDTDTWVFLGFYHLPDAHHLPILGHLGRSGVGTCYRSTVEGPGLPACLPATVRYRSGCLNTVHAGLPPPFLRFWVPVLRLPLPTVRSAVLPPLPSCLEYHHRFLPPFWVVGWEFCSAGYR